MISSPDTNMNTCSKTTFSVIIVSVICFFISQTSSVPRAIPCSSDSDCVDVLDDYFAVCVNKRCYEGKRDRESCKVKRQCYQKYTTCDDYFCSCVFKRIKGKCVDDGVECIDDDDCKDDKECNDRKCLVKKTKDDKNLEQKIEKIVSYIFGGGSTTAIITGIIVYLCRGAKKKEEGKEDVIAMSRNIPSDEARSITTRDVMTSMTDGAIVNGLKLDGLRSEPGMEGHERGSIQLHELSVQSLEEKPSDETDVSAC